MTTTTSVGIVVAMRMSRFVFVKKVATLSKTEGATGLIFSAMLDGKLSNSSSLNKISSTNKISESSGGCVVVVVVVVVAVVL